MTTVASRKKWLVIPEGARPADWPPDWEFPSNLWPPGYPKKFAGGSYNFELTCREFDNEITARVLDRHNEDTDALMGYIIRGTFVDEDCREVRMKPAGEAAPWSSCFLALIREYKPGKWGFRDYFEFDLQQTVSECAGLTISLYGIVGGPSADLLIRLRS